MRRLRGFGDTTVVLLGRGEANASERAGAPLPEAAFTFESQAEGAASWRVRRFEVTEALSALYECVIDLVTESLHDNPDAMLGRYVMLQAQRESVARRFYGLVRRVEHRGTTATHRLARVYAVPALWTLSQRSDARVFQDVTALDVVQAVLREAGLYAGMLDLRLQRAYPTREYCVQHRETDLAFVLRLLEAEGVTFFFRHEQEGETLVLTDGAHGWDDVRTLDGGAIPVAGAELRTHRVEAVRHLVWEREQRPTGVAVRDFDFTRPDYRVERMVPRRREGERNLYDPAPALTLGGYNGAMYTTDDGAEQAPLRLEAERARAAVGAGDGVVIGMAPGGLFQLTLAGAHLAPQRYVVTRVTHAGEAPESLVVSDSPRPSDDDRYRNRFECAPVEAPLRPARVTPRPTIAGLQTATVVGPGGEEIYTDEHGRIKVQFHWDRAGTRDEHASCWLRVMQGPWAGDGWGFQFVPRVGMEVAVSFLDGDPDRPVVVGALYNGRNPAPFTLPRDRSRAGVRTRTVGGQGHNELSFEDGAGREQVYLRAQRDLDIEVERDRTVQVARDETVGVSRNQTQTVSGWQREAVTGDQTVTVQAARAVQVGGDQTHRVGGHDTVTVSGCATRDVTRDLTQRVGGRARHEVGGAADDLYRGDHTVRVRGHHTTVVGSHDARRTSHLHVEGRSSFHSTHTTEVSSARDVVLRCGRSAIRLTPDRIELVAPEVVVRGGENRVTVGGERVRVRAAREVVLGADRVVVKSQGAAVKLDAEAKVMGSKVQLAQGSIALDDAPDDPARATTIELRDRDGNPIPHQRFVLVAGDGSEQTGALDREGRATLDLDDDVEVTFPDLFGVVPG